MLSHSLCPFIVGHRTSLGSCCCSPSSLSSLGTCFSSSYQDLAKHIIDLSVADVRNCSTYPHGSFIRPVLVGRKGKEGKSRALEGRMAASGSP